VLDVTLPKMPVGFVRQCPAELFLVAAFGRESASQEDGEGSLAMKRYRAGLDNNYLAKVVAS